MALRDYVRFFSNPDYESEEKALEEARQIMDWTSRPYHAKYLDWMDREIGKPIDISSHRVVESAVRANTFREIRSYLERLRRSAQAKVGGIDG